MTRSLSQIAVITGDIVGSTRLGPQRLERALAALSNCAEVQGNWHGAPLNFTRQRGDGWQVALARPEMALRTALAFRAAIKAEDAAFDCYMGIGFGAMTGDLPSDLNRASGYAFTTSGIALDVTKQASPEIKINVNPDSDHGPYAAATTLADLISQGWTQAQARAIHPLLDPDHSISYTEIARRLGISRQSVTKSLQAAGEKHITVALAQIEQTGIGYD